PGTRSPTAHGRSVAVRPLLPILKAGNTARRVRGVEPSTFTPPLDFEADVEARHFEAEPCQPQGRGLPVQEGVHARGFPVRRLWRATTPHYATIARPSKAHRGRELGVSIRPPAVARDLACGRACPSFGSWVSHAPAELSCERGCRLPAFTPGERP